MTEHKNAATLLVEIAEDLYVFGCTTGGDSWAAPKQALDQQRPLAEIRPDIAAMYAAKYDKAPAASALGDAMTVLEGKARKAEPSEPTERLLAMLSGGDSKATMLIKMAQEHYVFGVTTSGDVYAVPRGGPNIAHPLRGGRRSLRSELGRKFYEKHKTAAGNQALADALLVLEGEAQGAEPAEVALRCGRDPLSDELVLDLGRDDGQVVIIGTHGWEVSPKSPVLFWRTNATLPLPVPLDGGRLAELAGLINVPPADWPLLLAWLVAALFPDIPHPVLLLRGEHGTAKSSAARLLTSLIDKCASQLRTAPRNVEDWAVACAGSWVTCLDNVSGLQPWLQDAICRAVTGDGMLRRELYTNSDVSVLAFRRVIAITGIDPGPLNGDLADRLLSAELERIPDDKRSGEEDISAKWREIHPAVLGALLNLACDVLRVLPRVRRTSLPRMADFARVVLAVDEVLGTDGYARFEEQAGQIAEHVADSDPVILNISEHIRSPWSGSARELIGVLTPEHPPKDWPSTPQAMGARLARAAPVLRRLGWQVDFTRTGRKRIWSLIPPPAELLPAGSSPSSSPTPAQPELGKHDDASDDGWPDGDDWGDDVPEWGDSTDDSDSQDESPGQDVDDGRDARAGKTSLPACPRHQTVWGRRKGCPDCERLPGLGPWSSLPPTGTGGIW
jgi:hypothetical protein